MTATKIVEQNDGSPLLETFDFRSEFAFDDFVEWIVTTLPIKPENSSVGENLEAFSFDWKDATFIAGWNDEHGCYIKAPSGSAQQLRQLQAALAD